MDTIALDKSLDTNVSEGHGTITIRVVVVEKGVGPKPSLTADNEPPADAEPEELLPETGKRANATFLEEPKRGRQCCVFLINGQRQHAWDNQFIVRDLELKYLRNRMIVVVDCDGLKPEAIAQLMQGSRHQFFEGSVYSDLESRLIATLKGDPDLRQLEEEAEEDISSLEAGDEAVKATLDQLIDAHNDAASHATDGRSEASDGSTEGGTWGTQERNQDIVVRGDSSIGLASSEPILNITPDISSIRLKPNDVRRILIHSKPEAAWKVLTNVAVTLDPPIKELQITRTPQLVSDEVLLEFVEPEGFERDEYPIEALLRVTATFKGYDEPRVVERRIVVNPRKIVGPKPPPPPLKDDPTLLKVTSRQPIKIVVDGPDVHVKLRWDGKDELVVGKPPTWAFQVSCEPSSIKPQTFLTRPVEGRFELLIQAAVGLQSGEQLKFDIEAIGPGKTLATAFLADVVEPLSPRKVLVKTLAGGRRRPPYDLRYVKKDNWRDENCWGQVWSGSDAGSFDPPSAKSPLTIFINQDMDLLVSYRDFLLAKKYAEITIQQRINKYTAHVAFHLYQMYLKKKEGESTTDSEIEVPSDEQMRNEIQRVARTLLKLMEVSQ